MLRRVSLAACALFFAGNTHPARLTASSGGPSSTWRLPATSSEHSTSSANSRTASRGISPPPATRRSSEEAAAWTSSIGTTPFSFWTPCPKWVVSGRSVAFSDPMRSTKSLEKAGFSFAVAAFLIHWLLVRVQDGPPEAAPRFRSAARWRLAVCGACSRTRVRSARSSPPTHHRTTPRNRSAASGHGCWRLPNRRTMRPRWLWCLLTHMSALREFLATETASHDASKPICHFWSWWLAPSDPPRAGGSLSAVLAHAHERAPRAPRHRPTIAQRLEIDLPFLVMVASAFRSALLARRAQVVCPIARY